MMVLCGGTMAALRLATGVLFRGIFPRLASCHNQRRQRQWVDFRESTVLLWWHWWHMSNAGLLILGMLTKFEGTAASTWPLVTTGFSTPGTRAVNWINIEGKMTNLPVAIIYLQWVGVTLLQPASIPSSFMRSSYLDFVLAQLTSWTRQKFERHWGILPSQRVYHSTFHQLICVDLSWNGDPASHHFL